METADVTDIDDQTVDIEDDLEEIRLRQETSTLDFTTGVRTWKLLQSKAKPLIFSQPMMWLSHLREKILISIQLSRKSGPFDRVT